ncbi:hypothetical protein AB2B41_11310 [Marimonas sp. MJW-29]|uniref:Uncharacterized protein n=1 Tax=Sulfitobacter sediminis TaxID=3234186 RepID=A0ABV3RML2_9RHOB
MLSTQPDFLKGGIVLIDAENGTVVRTLPLLINPERLSRSFEVKSTGEQTNRSAPLRLTGPAVETITIEARLEVSDALARGERTAVEEGVRPQLATLQMLITPTSRTILDNDALQQSGALEIVPMNQPLALFVWGAQNIAPVRVTSLSYVENLHNSRLYPLVATVNMSLRVLSVDDLGVSSRGGALYLSYLRGIEASAERVPDGRASAMGIEGAL